LLRPRARRVGAGPLFATAVATPAAVAILAGGGFGAGARLLFAGLAGAALLVAVMSEPAAVAALVRQPAIVLLAALATLTALSALWSEGAAIDALRWALVIAGYAALALAAGALAGRVGATVLVAGIVLAALACALAGLVAMALHSEPMALFLDGSWRPAGPFEYPPALALLQVVALPGLLWAALWGRGEVRIVGALGAGLALTAIVLSGSRLQLGFALLVLLALAALARRGGAAPRRSGRVALALSPRAVLAAIAAGAAVAAIALAPGQDNGPLGVDLSHGRGSTWSAAVETAGERPWLGSGAETFELVSAPNQEMTAVRFAHSLPLEAWLELGVAGLALIVCLYVAVGLAVWRVRRQPEALLLGPGALLFLATNLFDWPWHLAGLGAIWAICLGGILAADLRR
jgi:O-antigen ligase